MTDNTSLVNLALQSYGDRTTITAAQLLAGSNNQAKQANLTFANTRDSLLRMAPWDCAMKTANLTYITSIPGTPENTSAATNLWAPGQPRPPWAYEYQYPNDCLRACWIIPATQTGVGSGVPITTAQTGGAPSTWLGEPIRFKVATDQFLMLSNPTVIAGGSGYVAGDIITLNIQNAPVDTTNRIGTFLANCPQGAPALIRVATVNGAGAILTCTVISQIIDASPAAGGSYFYTYQGVPYAASTTGAGTGATFGGDIEFATPASQRVILTNQQSATLVYVQQVTDPNVWDPLFQDAFVNALGGDLCLALTGDKALAKICFARANQSIAEARKADGNEGLTINEVTPDWIRGRGISWSDGLNTGLGFDWDQYGTYGI